VDIWNSRDAEIGRIRERKRKRKIKERKSKYAKKSKNREILYFFPIICSSGGSKSRLTKAARAEPSGQRRRYCGAKYMSKSKYTTYLSISDHFLKVRCRKNAHHRGTTSKSIQKWSGVSVLSTFWLRNVFRTTTACTFFDIATSINGPDLVCWVHFDLAMCFAPQCRALFRHLNFQKWSEREVVFLTFHL
jgi:hypothetical protein